MEPYFIVDVIRHRDRNIEFYEVDYGLIWKTNLNQILLEMTSVSEETKALETEPKMASVPISQNQLKTFNNSITASFKIKSNKYLTHIINFPKWKNKIKVSGEFYEKQMRKAMKIVN